MRSLWLLPLLALGIGCQSVPRDLSLLADRAVVRKPAQVTASKDEDEKPPKSSEQVVVVSPRVLIDDEDQEKWLVDLPPTADGQAARTVMVVPVPTDPKPQLPAPPATAEVPKMEETAISPELLSRLATLEATIEHLNEKLEAKKKDESVVLMQPDELNYKVGFSR